MKVVDTPTLRRLVGHARMLRLSRLMTKTVEKHLDPDGKHILSTPMIHGDVQCVRCLTVLCKLRNTDDPASGVLDIAVDDWNRLPEHKETDS